MIKRIKRAVIGKPLPSWEFKHQRLNNLTALAVFASDSLSSVAYATEEIFLVLMSVGPALLGFSLPISLVILFLLWILILSYRQTIEAYPKGGGAYIVAKENLGKYPSLVAAGSLLLDYILTVAVSIAAGIAALTSAFPELLPYKVIIGITIILIISILNLKGVKESGFIFAVPTYLFVVSFFIMIGVGFFRYFTGQIIVMPIQNTNTVVSFSVFLLLRAFSSGCAALTGIEAVSDGVIGEMAEFQDGSAFVWRSQQIFDEIRSDVPTHDVKEIDELYVELWAAYDARADPSAVETLAGGIIHELDGVLGVEDEENNLLDYVENIRVLLEQTKQEYSNGDTDLALSLATKAYLDNFEFLEAPLIELDQKELSEEVEVMLREELRSMIKSGEPSSKIDTQVDAILEKMDTIATVVPEFGTIAMMVLAVAIISIVAVTSKSRISIRV